MNKQKGISTTLSILLIVLSIAVIVGGVVAYKYISAPQGQPSSNKPSTTTEPGGEDETTNWKTYRNEKFGFEFKYPMELEANSSGPNEEQKKLDRGETISGTVLPSYDTIAFSNSAKKEQFNVIIFHVRKDEISTAGFNSYLSMGSVCDTRWIDSVSEEPILLNKNGIFVVEAQVVSGGPKGRSSAGCYYFKNSEGNLVVFNISGFEQKSDFLNVFHLVGDKILSTLSLIK